MMRGEGKRASYRTRQSKKRRGVDAKRKRKRERRKRGERGERAGRRRKTDITGSNSRMELNGH